MSTGYGGSWESAEQVEAAARRAQRARLAAVREQVDLLRAQAEAARRIGVTLDIRLDDAEPAASASSDELAARATGLERAVMDARAEVESRMSEAWRARLGSGAPRRTRTTPTAAESYAEIHRQAAARLDDDDRFARERRRAAAARARGMLADNLARCDPGDIEDLERLASALGDDDTTAEQVLRRKVAESIARRKEATRIAVVRRELLSMANDALPAERAGLRAMIRHSADPETARAHVERAVVHSDRIRAQSSVATITAEALRDLGCEVGVDFATFLSDRGAAIAGLREHPGYGVRVSVSETEIETLVVRRVNAPTSHDLVVQRAVCGRLDSALDALRQAGVTLTTFRRVEPGVEPVPKVAETRWADECRTSGAARTDWRAEPEPARKELRHG